MQRMEMLFPIFFAKEFEVQSSGNQHGTSKLLMLQRENKTILIR